MQQQGFGFDEIGHEERDEGVEKQQTPRPPITLIPGYLNQAQQNALLDEAEHYPFSRPELTLFGRTHPIPRRQVWFGDDGCDYLYSGLFIRAEPWPKYALRLRQKLQRDFGLISNGVLVNHYHDGSDTMGWHSDDEAEIVPGSDIASVTLGASRPFFLRHTQSKTKVELMLNSGDLLIMHWPMQSSWQHALPKRAKVNQPRLNLTYRHLIPHFHHG